MFCIWFNKLPHISIWFGRATASCKDLVTGVGKNHTLLFKMCLSNWCVVGIASHLPAARIQ